MLSVTCFARVDGPPTHPRSDNGPVHVSDALVRWM